MTIIAEGKLRGELLEYEDGRGCCIWYPFPGHEDIGQCFDFAYEDIDDLIALLRQLKSGGKIGMGTARPIADLHVVGAVVQVEEALYDYGDVQDDNGNSLLTVPLLEFEGKRVEVLINVIPMAAEFSPEGD